MRSLNLINAYSKIYEGEELMVRLKKLDWKGQTQKLLAQSQTFLQENHIGSKRYLTYSRDIISIYNHEFKKIQGLFDKQFIYNSPLKFICKDLVEFYFVGGLVKESEVFRPAGLMRYSLQLNTLQEILKHQLVDGLCQPAYLATLDSEGLKKGYLAGGIYLATPIRMNKSIIEINVSKMEISRLIDSQKCRVMHSLCLHRQTIYVVGGYQVTEQYLKRNEASTKQKDIKGIPVLQKFNLKSKDLEKVELGLPTRLVHHAFSVILEIKETPLMIFYGLNNIGKYIYRINLIDHSIFSLKELNYNFCTTKMEYGDSYYAPNLAVKKFLPSCIDSDWYKENNCLTLTHEVKIQNGHQWKLIRIVFHQQSIEIEI